MRLFGFLALAFWQMSQVCAAAAQTDCFCLQDTAENLMKDCIEQRRGVAGVQILCHEPLKGYRVRVDATGWTRIPAGEPDCRPCVAAEEHTRSEVIRGNGEKEDEPTRE